MASQIITTVIQAPQNYALTDLETVKDDLKIADNDHTDDRFLARSINQASRMVSNYINRVLAVETVQDVVYPGIGPNPMQIPGCMATVQLTRWPVISVASVTTTDQDGNVVALVQDTDFTLDADAGWLMRLYNGFSTSWDPLVTTVVYTAGFPTVPDDVVEAVLLLVKIRYKGRLRDPLTKSQDSPSLGLQTFWAGGLPGRDGLPEDVAGLLDSYRVPVVA